MNNEVAVIRYDNHSLFTVDLYIDGKFSKNIGGGYPGSKACEIDAKGCWGRDIEVRNTRYTNIDDVEQYLALLKLKGNYCRL